VNLLGVPGFGFSSNTSSFGPANTISLSHGNSNWRLVENGVITPSTSALGYIVGSANTPGIDWYTIGNGNSYYLRINLGSPKTVNKMVITCGALYNLAGCELRYSTDLSATSPAVSGSAFVGCNMPLGSVTNNTNKMITMEFPAVTARYLELRIDRRTGEFHNIHKLELFGAEPASLP